MPETPALSAEQKAEHIREFADDMKADRIETLDVHSKTSVTDFFIVCTGNSTTHIQAIGARVAEKMREIGVRPLRVEDGGGGGWALLDYGDVVFHVMSEEKRQFYDLESLWTNMQSDPNLM